MYYDLVNGPSKLRNEAAERFEQYCANFISANLSELQVSRSRKYTFHKNQIDTPDLLVKKNGRTIIALECKATKLTYGGQFASDPIEEAKTGYNELAKGVFQLWRYFSHARRGFTNPEFVDADAHGIVLTLDSWFLIPGEMENKVVDEARKLADNEGDIADQDRRKVVFCAITDLESLLTNSDEALFLRTLAAARERKFSGRSLMSADSSSQRIIE